MAAAKSSTVLPSSEEEELLQEEWVLRQKQGRPFHRFDQDSHRAEGHSRPWVEPQSHQALAELQILVALHHHLQEELEHPLQENPLREAWQT